MQHLTKQISVIDAPSNLGLQQPSPGKEPGVIGLPQALRATGLVERLGAVEGGRVPPRRYSPDPDPDTGVRNSAAIGEFSLDLAARVVESIQAGEFPLVLGGDCSILIGSMLGLRRLGRYGLFFVDGHLDYLHPGNSKTAGAAGMDLALVTGRGPEALTNIAGLGPLVREADVVAFGYRDVEDPATDERRDVYTTAMSLYPLDDVRRLGVEGAAAQALAALRASGLDGAWIHLDADVLDDELMPAVDARVPGGFSYEELIALLRVLLSSGLAAGMQITIYDPDLDPDGRIAREFADALVTAFARSQAVGEAKGEPPGTCGET